MANGDALKKRYKIVDEETGEEVEGWVLKPTEDDLARTVMYVYAQLCGITPESRGFHMIGRYDGPRPQTEERDLLDAIVEREFDPEEMADSFLAEDLSTYAFSGGADGSLEAAFLILKATGCTPVALVCASELRPDPKRTYEAEQKLDEIRTATEYAARLVGSSQAE